MHKINGCLSSKPCVAPYTYSWCKKQQTVDEHQQLDILTIKLDFRMQVGKLLPEER